MDPIDDNDQLALAYLQNEELEQEAHRIEKANAEAEQKKATIQSILTFMMTLLSHTRLHHTQLEEELVIRDITLVEFLENGAGLQLKDSILHKLEYAYQMSSDAYMMNQIYQKTELVAYLNTGIIAGKLNTEPIESITKESLYKAAYEGGTSVERLRKHGFLNNIMRAKAGTIFTQVIEKDTAIQKIVSALANLIHGDLKVNIRNGEAARLTMRAWDNLLKKDTVPLHVLAASPLFEQMVKDKDGIEIIQKKMLAPDCAWEQIFISVTSCPESQMGNHSKDIINHPYSLHMMDKDLQLMNTTPMPLIGKTLLEMYLTKHNITALEFAKFNAYIKKGVYTCLLDDAQAYLTELIAKDKEDKRVQLCIKHGRLAQPSITEHFKQNKVVNTMAAAEALVMQTVTGSQDDVMVVSHADAEKGQGGFADGRSTQANHMQNSANLVGKKCAKCGVAAQTSWFPYLQQEPAYSCWKCQVADPE